MYIKYHGRGKAVENDMAYNWQGLSLYYFKILFMKNAFITAILAIALTSFFSFTNSKSVSFQEEYSRDDFFTIDTVPVKKDSMKRKSKTVPYDSFGKPKKMDTTRSK